MCEFRQLSQHFQLVPKPLRCYGLAVDRAELSQYLAELGRKGGKARLKTMTPEERRRIALRASKAAAAARKKKAKQKDRNTTQKK